MPLPFIVSLPSKNDGSFHTYVSLPEGISFEKNEKMVKHGIQRETEKRGKHELRSPSLSLRTKNHDTHRILHQGLIPNGGAK